MHHVPPAKRARPIQEGTGSVRFVSAPDFSKLIGSVRFGQICFPVRRDSACAFRTRRGSVRFGSVRFRVRFRPVPKLNGSVRFAFLFLPAPRRLLSSSCCLGAANPSTAGRACVDSTFGPAFGHNNEHIINVINYKTNNNKQRH